MCAGNLKTLETFKDTWALKHHKTTNDTPTLKDLADIRNDIGMTEAGWMLLVKCPKEGAYTLGRVGQKPQCSIPGHMY